MILSIIVSAVFLIAIIIIALMKMKKKFKIVIISILGFIFLFLITILINELYKWGEKTGEGYATIWNAKDVL